MTCRHIILAAIVAAAFTTGCKVRALLKPQYGEPENHIYFIEQEQMKDSRIKKCDIAADNSVSCATQYDLE